MSVSWSGSWTLWRRCHTGQAHFKSRNPIPKVRMCTEFGKEGTEERVAVAGRNPRELESQRAGMPTEGFLSPSRVFVARVRMGSAPSPHPARTRLWAGLRPPRAHPSTTALSKMLFYRSIPPAETVFAFFHFAFLFVFGNGWALDLVAPRSQSASQPTTGRKQMPTICWFSPESSPAGT